MACRSACREGSQQRCGSAHDGCGQKDVCAVCSSREQGQRRMWEFIKRVWRAAGAAVSVAERLWQIIVGLLGLTGAAVMAWLSQTWDWYWLTFSWAGTAIAFLVSYLLLSVGALLFSVSAAIYARRNTREKILEDPSGPLIWSMSPTINGPLHNPYAIIIRGNNISTTGVVLRESYILSSITGKRIDMMICAVDSEGATHVVGVDEINPVPPGARLEMVAHVGGDRVA